MTDLLALLPPDYPLILRDGERAVLADQALEGIVAAEAYQKPEPMHCAVPVADLTDEGGQRLDQLIYGEVFDLLHRVEGRGWGRARRDGVIGWVQLEQLKPGIPLATRRVKGLKSPLPFNALVLDQTSGIDEAALAPVGQFDSDLVAVAEAFLGCPHVLGGRTPHGTDCSGLVQQALYACGHYGPRRTKAQADLGQAVDKSELARNDLALWLNPDIAWTGHSALMVDAVTVIHSTGHHGKVVVEPLAEVEARMLAQGYQSALFRRL